MEESNVLVFKKKTIWEKTKDWTRDRIDDVKYFYRTHKEEVILFGPVVVGGAIELSKKLIRRSNLAKEEQIKEEYWYDPSLGHYWKLRRRPNKNECLEIDRRKQNGERLGDILESLKLLR